MHTSSNHEYNAVIECIGIILESNFISCVGAHTGKEAFGPFPGAPEKLEHHVLLTHIFSFCSHFDIRSKSRGIFIRSLYSLECLASILIWNLVVRAIVTVASVVFRV